MRQYNFNLDLARALAIVGVVAIHVWYPVYSRPDFLGGFSWWLAYTINALFRVSVPFFLMTSGSLLLPRRPQAEFKDIVNRIFYRLLVPLVFWSLVYLWWERNYEGNVIALAEALRIFFSGGIFHLYFLVILIGLYALLPLLRRIKINLAAAFTLGSVLYVLQILVFKSRNIFNFFTLWLPYLGYFLAGPYLLNLASTPERRRLALTLWSGSVMVTIILGYFNLSWLKEGIRLFWGMGGVEYFTNWLSPNVIIMSLSGFYLLTNRKFRSRPAVAGLARYALGIYLVHMLIIKWLDKFAGFYLDHGHSRLWLFGNYKFILVLTLSYVITAVAVRLPLVRLLWGEKK